MSVFVQTFGGNTLNSSDYETALLNPFGGTSAKPVYIEQAEADSQDAGTYTVDVQNKVLRVWIKNYANRNALKAQLKTWFKRGTRATLVALFKIDNLPYQLNCRVVSCTPDPDNRLYYTIILQTGESCWRAVNLTTEADWTITGNTETQAISVGGADETFLNVDLTPTAAPVSGWLYQKLYRLPNTPGLEHGKIAWCITVDTAALVTASKMRSDCNDLRIIDLNTGQELKRWIQSPNNASTKVWIILDLKKGFSLTLKTTVASSGAVQYLEFNTDATTKAKMAQMPQTGILYHNNEWFSYTKIDSKKCRAYVGSRKLFGTTEEGHTAGVTFSYIQYPLLMKYGNASATDPAAADANYDDEKPLFKLTSSNTQWVWDATTKFYEPLFPNKVGTWKFNRKARNAASKIFYVKQDAESGDPAIGFKVASFQVGSQWKDEDVVLTATFYRAAGPTLANVTGDKYRSNANWVPLTALRRSVNNVDYFTLHPVNTPGSAGAYEAWNTGGAIGVAAGTKYLQAIMKGGYKAAKDAYAVFEMLTATVDFNSSNIPTGTFLSEVNNFPMAVTIKNETVGDEVTIDTATIINKTFALSSEDKTAKYDGVNTHSAVTMDDESRSVFLRLRGGTSNTIRITGTNGQDLGTLKAVMSYYRRRLA